MRIEGVKADAVNPASAVVPPGGRPGPSPELKALADVFGALDTEVQRFKPVLKKHEEARKAIQALYDSSPADQDYNLLGDKYEVQIGVRDIQRKIPSMRKLFKVLKDALFFEHCTFPLKVVDAVLPGVKQLGIVTGGRTGSRPVKAVALSSGSSE